MHESDFRDRIDLALWTLARGIGIDVVLVDAEGLIDFDQKATRDMHMIRTSWPLPEKGDASPRQDVFCARTLLARCETLAFREVPPGRLANAVRDALTRA